MVTYRIDRLNKEFLRLISGMLQTRIKNSDAGEAILTMVSVSRDLGHAKVFYTLINQDEREKVQTALDAAAPVLRAMLGKEMRLRTIPGDAAAHDSGAAFLLRRVGGQGAQDGRAA